MGLLNCFSVGPSGNWGSVSIDDSTGTDKRLNSSSLCSATLLGAASNSSQIARSKLLALARPFMFLFFCAGSRLAKLTSFMATALGVRPIVFANAMMVGFELWSFPNGMRQYRLKQANACSRVQFWFFNLALERYTTALWRNF